jgi:hypothetical protein
LSPEKIVALKNPEEIVFFSHALVGKSGTIRLCSTCGLDRQTMVDFGVGFWCGHWLKAISMRGEAGSDTAINGVSIKPSVILRKIL